MRASYLSRLSPVALRARGEAARFLLDPCRLCPRACGAGRLHGEVGFCAIGGTPAIASAGPHFGEESCLIGSGGSGTIFFAGCNLGCVFCQNAAISHGGDGERAPIERLAAMMLQLQRAGCHNINLVTPTHQVPQILDALAVAAANGLTVPLVYNCGGYESLETLRLLDGVVDVYMPDVKYGDALIARRYSGVSDYPAIAEAAVAEMHRQVGDLQLDDRGVARRGLLVRHLVLPGGLAGTPAVMAFLARLSPHTCVNMMAQYRPCHRAHAHPELARRITGEELRQAVEVARAAGLHRLEGGGG